jgi:4-hydroxyphenylpyruvate dioxygenase
MGPFPHDAPRAEISEDNPAGTNGFEFVEFAHPEPEKLEALFTRMGYQPVARHREKAITVWRQGDINYILNAEKGSFADRFVTTHGPCAPSMAWRVADAKKALAHAVSKGAEEYTGNDKTLDVPAIVGIGGSLLYFVDTWGDEGSLYDADFDWMGERDPKPEGAGFYYLDHLTHNVIRGNMDKWWDFYRDLFNFKQIHFFDIEGKLTGLVSRAITSPCGRIRIPLNESTDDKSQIEEFLRKYNGEGIQHIACFTDDIYTTVEKMRAAGVEFLDTPDAYFEVIDERIPNHGEDVPRLAKNKILIDADMETKKRLLLQIFTQNNIGPIFFEIIQRKGNEGFGEGNFQALFESIERDQMKRGFL